MNKRLIYYGVILAVLASVIALFYVPSVNSSLLGVSSIINQTVAVRANGFSVNPVRISNESLIVLGYRASNSVNFYLFNSLGFSSVSDYISRNRSVAAVANTLYGRGLIASVMNSTVGTYPVVKNTSARPNVTILGNDTYYIVFENRNGMSINLTTNVNIITKSATPSLNVLQLLIPGIVLFMGMGLIALGIIGWGEQKKDVVIEKDEVEELYKNVGKKSAGKKRK